MAAPSGKKPALAARRADSDQGELPDDVRRRDADPAPGGFVHPEEESRTGGRGGSPDGGVAEHPIHDEDLEDRGPEDYERELDDVERATSFEDPERAILPLDPVPEEDEADEESDSGR
jgi:hypothetical protein